VWLFDVDGTLLLTDGAARQAFSTALHSCLGIEDDLADIAFAGRTDPLILGDILAKHGRAMADGELERFWGATFGCMRTLLAPARGRVLSGVTELLAAIAAESGWIAGLLTGNTTEMARIKLTHYGLVSRFDFGAFGEEAADRDRLAQVAVNRARERWGVAPDRCIVVGDTEHDIQCARAAGAHVVAVASGQRSRAELSAHRPDLLLDDLRETQALIEWARRLARR
jgi:phosphoglycolate phosphatase-like HAD superfamily hydrolase